MEGGSDEKVNWIQGPVEKEAEEDDDDDGACEIERWTLSVL